MRKTTHLGSGSSDSDGDTLTTTHSGSKESTQTIVISSDHGGEANMTREDTLEYS
jgi:hypothetical protein